MELKRALLATAAISIFSLALAGCGGGGGGSQSPGAILPVTNVPQSSGPVGYMTNTGSKSSGSIAAGSASAVVAVMSSDTQASGFSADSFTVTTAAASSQSQSVRRAGPRVSRPAHAQAPELFAADDGVLLKQLAQHAETGAAPRGVQPEARTTAASVGSQMQVWVQQGYPSRANTLIPATLVAQSTHGNIWVQTTLAPALQPLAPQLASVFENAFASDTQNFASADYSNTAPALHPQYATCSSTGAKQGTGTAYITEPADHRIDVMIVDTSQIGGLGGYFTGANLMTQGALNCLSGTYRSNQAPFIFVGWSSSFGNDYEIREDYVRSTAHELQHLINFVNHSILAAGAASSSFNGNEQQYLNEGLSMLAQDFAVNRLYGQTFDAADALPRAAAYLAQPANFSISAFTGIDASWGSTTPQNNCSGGCYGGAYLFARYLRDRFGAGFAQRVETSGTTGAANLQAVTGEPAGELFGDFALAMAASAVGADTQGTRFAFGTLDLNGTYADQFGTQHPMGGLAPTAASGSSTTVSAPLGGFAFVAVPAVPPAGMNVQISDGNVAGGFSLLGGLAQH